MEDKIVFVVDWDGVCQTNCWPEWGEWIPAAVDSLHALLELGEVRIFSSRLNPYKFGHDGRERRDAGEITADYNEMRCRLDAVGLQKVVIHDTPGKPSGTYYIDDRAIEFRGSWDEVLERVAPPGRMASAPTDGVGPVAPVAGGRPYQSALRHPNSARFHELLKEAGELHDRKQQDYGAGNDPFANVRASTAWGVDGWIGAMIRLSDKVRRLESLARKGYLMNEAAIDSFMDIAVYALIARVLYEQGMEEAA